MDPHFTFEKRELLYVSAGWKSYFSAASHLMFFFSPCPSDTCLPPISPLGHGLFLVHLHAHCFVFLFFCFFPNASFSSSSYKKIPFISFCSHLKYNFSKWSLLTFLSEVVTPSSPLFFFWLSFSSIDVSNYIPFGFFFCCQTSPLNSTFHDGRNYACLFTTL